MDDHVAAFYKHPQGMNSPELNSEDAAPVPECSMSGGALHVTPMHSLSNFTIVENEEYTSLFLWKIQNCGLDENSPNYNTSKQK